LIWVDSRFPTPHLFTESPLSSKGDGSYHILSNSHPGSNRTTLIKVILEPIVNQATNALALVLRVHPTVEPEFFRMKHPRRIPHLPKTQSCAGGGVETCIAFEVVFCLVKTIIVKSPLLNTPRSLRKDRVIDFRQPPVIRIFESSNLKRESALGQDSVDSSDADVKLFARDRPLVCRAQAALLMREIDGILRKL